MTEPVPHLMRECLVYDSSSRRLVEGYPLENRSYTSINDPNQKYQFTSKERDHESSQDGVGYDYFGARYYDNRIANWTSIDPLFEKHIQWSPYNYVLRNPIFYIDPDGRQTSLHEHMLGDDNLKNFQYKRVTETNEKSKQRYFESKSSKDWAVTTDVGLIDPIDIGVNLASAGSFLSFKVGTKLVANILTKEATKEVVEDVGKVVLKESAEYTFPKLAAQLEKQLADDGANTIFKSLKSFETRLAEHTKKVGTLMYKSSVEREIKTFEKSIETIKQFIINKGLKQ